MSKEELVNEFTYSCDCEAKNASGNPQMCFMCIGIRVPKGKLEDVLVAAYNRAIEDVVKLAEGDPYLYVSELEKLKIRDNYDA